MAAHWIRKSSTAVAVAGLTFVVAAGLTACGGAPSPRPVAARAIQGQGNRSGLESVLAALASDATQGRDNATPGSLLAEGEVIGQLKTFAIGLNSGTGDDAFKQTIDGGTNILGLIPGGELSDEYVIVGAHYDHVGSSCRSAVPSDHICNGATDNAASVAEVLSIGREIAQRPKPPRRSVILALWDREEDGKLGSKYYVEHPLRPLAQTVAYVNYDNQGQNLLPSLRSDTIAVGSETGGLPLQSIVTDGGRKGPLDLHSVSLIFGQGRSDHVNFTSAGIPTVFFTDATGPCYHTAQDEIGIVDFGKLRFEAKMGVDVVQAIVEGDRMPFSGTAPIATFEDAVTIQPLANKTVADIGRFGPSDQAALLKFRDDMNAMVAAGPANFGADDVGILLTDTARWVNILSTGQCDGFLKGN